MALTIKHKKNNTVPNWTQADLDAEIVKGNFASGTKLADITLAQDWNDTHNVTGTLDATQNNVSVDGTSITGSGTPANPLIAHFTATTPRRPKLRRSIQQLRHIRR